MFALSLVAYSECFYHDMQENILRLHILAKSDSIYDQSVKLAVRDRILSATADIDVRDAKLYCQTAEKAANKYLYENNIPYRAKAQSGIFYFPKKDYGTLTLPAGEYKGIRITLADGNGENWWCIMCPPVCTADNERAMDMLKSRLNDNSYSVITRPKIAFKILDFLNKKE